jgi:hypothetical protein
LAKQEAELKDSLPGYLVAQRASDEDKQAYAEWVSRVLGLINARDWAAATTVIRSDYARWIESFPYTIYAVQLIDLYARRFGQLGKWKYDRATYQEALLHACAEGDDVSEGAMRSLLDLGLLMRYFHRHKDAAKLFKTARDLDPQAYSANNGPTDPDAL